MPPYGPTSINGRRTCPIPPAPRSPHVVGTKRGPESVGAGGHLDKPPEWSPCPAPRSVWGFVGLGQSASPPAQITVVLQASGKEWRHAIWPCLSAGNKAVRLVASVAV